MNLKRISLILIAVLFTAGTALADPAPDGKALSVRSFTFKTKDADKAAEDKWYGKVWMEDKGLHDEKPWYDPAYDAAGWSAITVPGFWADQGGPTDNGVVWYRK